MRKYYVILYRRILKEKKEYCTFCSAEFWKCLADKGLGSFNTGLEDCPQPREPNAELLWEKEKENIIIPL
jgi:hypothetical protein